MKFIWKKLIFSCLLLTASTLVTAKGLNEELERASLEAYLYAYPMVLMDVTRKQATNYASLDEAPLGRGPLNQIVHLSEFPDATFTDVVRPNVDTLYSVGWFDVSIAPIQLSIPASNGRYYMLQMLDMWSDVFASPGSRTSGNEAQHFLIVSKNWQGEAPAGADLIRSPTNIFWVIGRVQASAQADEMLAANKFQSAINFKSLVAKQVFVADANVDMKIAPSAQVEAMDAEDFFGAFLKVVRKNAPHANDYPLLARLKRMGLISDINLAWGDLTAEVQASLGRAMVNGKKMILKQALSFAEIENGWQVATEFMGTYGTSYTRRAIVAFVGLGANVPEDAVYPIASVDADGEIFSGDQNYVMHFEKDEFPPVEAFWSVTLYNDKQFLSDNPLNRYALRDRDDLVINADGSLDLYFQNVDPGDAKRANWLPTPRGKFDFLMRLYRPGLSILDGSWVPPAIHKAN